MTMALPISDQAPGCRCSRDQNMNTARPIRGRAPGCPRSRDQNMSMAPPIRERVHELPRGRNISMRVLEETPLGIEEQNIFMDQIMAPGKLFTGKTLNNIKSLENIIICIMLI